jgi:hypothetical protein
MGVFAPQHKRGINNKAASKVNSAGRFLPGYWKVGEFRLNLPQCVQDIIAEGNSMAMSFPSHKQRFPE